VIAVADGADTIIGGIGPEAAALLAALHGRCFDEPWNAEAFAALLALPTVRALVAQDAGPVSEPVGFLMAQRAAQQAEILTMGVLPAYRRTGIAGRMLAKACDELAAHGARDVFLEVDETNLAGMRLYRAAGFETVGRRVGYYQNLAGGRTDAISLCRRLAGDDG
jgi:ribosomal-protein-alanine N-acetyltransferase